MTFTSVAFLFFFAVMFLGYRLCPPRFRFVWLLLGSCYFYAAFVPKYILILAFLIVVDFVLAQQIEKSQGKRKHFLFCISLFSNLGVLFVFKYFNFFNGNIAAVAELLHWNYSIGALKLILPLGLSFHVFQSISYVVEVYRGKYQAEKHLGIYALYVMFFPQLIAGPIERPAHLLPQLKNLGLPSSAQIFSGLRLLAWGFFKKLVIADRLARSVDYVYANASQVPGPSIALTLIFFAFQLYADFSGYSDIARGSARVFGIELVPNFDRPYFSTSIAEFWRRWHMSLSNWFRDYLYFPLVYASRNKTRLRLYLALFATFLLMGLWHGAAWTFVSMGAYFGICIVVGLLTQPLRAKVSLVLGLKRVPRLHMALRMVMTFLLVSVGWVFFRAPDMLSAGLFLRELFVGWQMPLSQFVKSYYQHPFAALGISHSELLLSLGAILVLVLVEGVEKNRHGALFQMRSPFMRSLVYSSLLLAIVLFGMFATNPFIYFQF